MDKTVAKYLLESALKDAQEYFEHIGDEDFAYQLRAAKFALEVLCREST